ncbi:MAG: DUF4867 family protein [Eubacteriales bacterium]|jgi:hypothetical protein|nr:DUF4867 family protein [Eubacteriales bacterium]MDD4105561.1 DUF4867 family protein [Eubacteriales bacterium]MDD4710549.1 DUF4867 family protein [Eubacteriales bacterium]NLO15545.1 DUF4867 family protein [Clostridiales bacterium]
MKIYDISDPAFKPYGRIAEGYPVEGLMDALGMTPLGDWVRYVPKEPLLHAAQDADTVGDALFGGMPFQFGWCNGYNTKLNCLEYHRDSEFNLGSEDFILLLARQEEIVDGRLDTAHVKAFRVPKGSLVEVYATTLHFAPCSAKKGQGFRVMVALPEKTNTEYSRAQGANVMDKQLWARNKWLLAHADSAEAKQGAFQGLVGKNIDIESYI